MTRSKLETAKHLAKEHFKVEPELKKVFLVEPLKEDDPREPIKLLEVVEGAIERGVEPIAFPSDFGSGVPFPSVIIELSPREFEEFKRNKLYFGNESWRLRRGDDQNPSRFEHGERVAQHSRAGDSCRLRRRQVSSIAPPCK